MIKTKLNKNAKKVDNFLINFINKQKNSLLVAPMKYGVISGGKKIRSTLILDFGIGSLEFWILQFWNCESFDGKF